MDPRDELIRALADELCKRVLAKAVAGLRKQHAQLSGDDSALRTALDEFCVQVQEGESFFWHAYELTAKQFIQGELEQLPLHERQAIWLQSEAGWDWLWDLNHPEDETEKPGKIPFDDSESTDYVYREYLLPFAEDYSSAGMDQYLEQAQRARFESDLGKQ